MVTEVDGSAGGVHDVVVVRLQSLRVDAGEPSYAEIARMVARLRVERGVPAHAALPARTTVYDAFRLGRRRLDRGLVEEITEALVREADSRQRLASPEPLRGTDEPLVPLPAEPAEPVSGQAARSDSAFVAPAPSSVAVGAEASDASAEQAAGPSRALRSRILLLCVGINLIGLVFIDSLQFPLWLDMIGTALAAIALGPWWGAGVAIVSSGLDGVFTGTAGLWFTPVAVCGALIWGYGARVWGMARSTGRFLLLNTAVALACTLIAAPITALVFGGFAPHESGSVTRTLLEHVPSVWIAVAISNVLFSMVDKLVTGFVALAALDVAVERWPWLQEGLGPRERQ